MLRTISVTKCGLSSGASCWHVHSFSQYSTSDLTVHCRLHMASVLFGRVRGKWHYQVRVLVSQDREHETLGGLSLVSIPTFPPSHSPSPSTVGAACLACIPYCASHVSVHPTCLCICVLVACALFACVMFACRLFTLVLFPCLLFAWQGGGGGLPSSASSPASAHPAGPLRATAGCESPALRP